MRLLGGTRSKWRFYIIKTKETRAGWPIYLYPVIFTEYKPCTFDGRDYDKQSFGVGICWLSWNLSWHGVNDSVWDARRTPIEKQ